MAKRNVHVTYDQSKRQWKVRKEDAKRASGYRGTQDEARDLAKRVAEREKSEVVVHRKDDGRIREKDSYGNDPRERKG